MHLSSRRYTFANNTTQIEIKMQLNAGEREEERERERKGEKLFRVFDKHLRAS